MLELNLHDGVATLAIRRPEKKNAFVTAMWAALGDHCRALAQAATARAPGSARVLVLQGEPGAFCAGADIEEMSALVADPAALAESNRIVLESQLALQQLPLPTIALIDGPCFGGGLGLAVACDFRLASSRASFAVTPSRLGLLYSIEDTRRLVRLLGDHRARRLLLRGERLDASTALAWGLLDELTEPEWLAATAERWVGEFARASRTSMAGIKATLALLSHSGGATEAAVRAAFDAAFIGADFAEGAAAFLARREPQFR